MNKIRKRIISLILIFVFFAPMACQCNPSIDEIQATKIAEMMTEEERARERRDATQVAARKTETAIAIINLGMGYVQVTTVPFPSTPTPTATPTRTPTPQPVTITVKVGEVAKFETFNVSVTKSQYEAGDPKGGIFVDVSVENKTSAPLDYTAKNFSATSSAGKQKVLVLPKPQGSTWADDFLPNSNVPAGAKAALRFVVQHSSIEKDFVFIVSFGNSTANILLGR